MLVLMQDRPAVAEPRPTRQPTGEDRARGQLATQRVVEHLEQVIFGGSVEAGDSLPSESELSADLGVSRLTIREGVRTLQARGLIEVAHGKRPVVAYPNATPLHDFFSASIRRDAGGLLELLEVRLAIEVHAAQLAARHATRTDIAAIGAALDAMREAGDDEGAFNAADVRFHAAIATSSGNRMIGFLVEGMEGPLRTSRLESLRGYRSQSPDMLVLVRSHEMIFESIVQRDPAGAAANMHRHLLQTRNDLRAAFAMRAEADIEPRRGDRGADQG